MDIEQQLRDIEAEPDLASKALKLAMLVASVFREIGCEVVVVCGSAIEFYTNGDYMSGDVDLCFHRRRRPDLRVVTDVMAKLHATGGPRSFKVAGLFVDILGELESVARTPCRRIQSDDGSQHVLVAQPEELLAEWVLMSLYPARDDTSLACARKLVKVCVSGDVAVDWQEALRVAALPEYRVEKELEELINEVKGSQARQTP